MRQFDVLRLCESTLKMLERNGIDARDVWYLDLYREYERLKDEGHKRHYIIAHLADEYNINAATVYRVIKRMAREIT